MRKFYVAAGVAASLVASLSTSTALAASDADIQALRSEISQMKQGYEIRIAELEAKLAKVEQKQETVNAKPAIPASSGRQVLDNSFNPSIGVILNGQYRNFSQDNSEIAGFAIGHEGERGKEGLSVEHTELNFAANVDDKFTGSVTAAIAEHEGETEVELEEAYVQTLPGLGLPNGMSIKAGRAFWTLGYLNEHHNHTDDFADRPLPYRVFFNNSFNDDGAEISYVLPTDFYSEIGGGIFRGDDFPAGGTDGESADSYSLFARVGGDIGDNQSWRIGGSWLSTTAGGRASNEDLVDFIGDTDFYIADLRYTWAPTGNPRNQELLLQGEYFWRNEDGTYDDTDAGTGAIAFDDNSSGWYGQAVYKFDPQWRVGYRYTQLNAPDVPLGLVGSALDSGGHDPYIHSIMADWTNSEFSRWRLQYNNDKSVDNQTDNQFILQYVMSLGAHGAHKY